MKGGNEMDDAATQALRNQIDPHFLFNALNAVASLTMENPAEAERLILRLAMFYRRILTQDQAAKITLDDELDLLEVYLDIEHVRFEDRLDVGFEIEEDTRDAYLPPFVLQAILKNSIRSGLRSVGPPTHILVSAKRVGSRVRLIVDDDGCASASAAGQHAAALEAASTRLRQSFGDDFVLHAEPKPAGGYVVEIEIPYGNEATCDKIDAP
jgi:two-component system, LytTR family, sensor kinase